MDKCSKCGCELKVIKGVNILENDDSPDKQTRLFRLLTLCFCRRTKSLNLVAAFRRFFQKTWFERTI